MGNHGIRHGICDAAVPTTDRGGRPAGEGRTKDERGGQPKVEWRTNNSPRSPYQLLGATKTDKLVTSPTKPWNLWHRCPNGRTTVQRGDRPKLERRTTTLTRVCVYKQNVWQPPPHMTNLIHKDIGIWYTSEYVDSSVATFPCKTRECGRFYPGLLVNSRRCRRTRKQKAWPYSGYTYYCPFTLYTVVIRNT